MNKRSLVIHFVHLLRNICFPPCQFSISRKSHRSITAMANTRVSSFVKKGKSQGDQIPGTKAATQNFNLLISSGIPSFDSYIGSGLPVGSLILVDEDANGTLAKIFMKYFIAEGVLSEQAAHVCSKDVDINKFLSELPGPVTGDGSDADSETKENENMKIAWRYQNMRNVSSQNVNENSYIGHYFDLTKTNTDVMKNGNFSYWINDEDPASDSFEENDYDSLYKSIRKVLEKGKYLISEKTKERTILRIGLLQIGSPLWPKSDRLLTAFLYKLRGLLRNSFATCMVTVPFHLYENKSLRAQCIHLSDICIQLQSLAGTSLEENPALRDYNGLFHIVKRAAINGLVNRGSQVADLAIKLRRRKLTIEKLHLPPQLEDTVQKEREACGDMGCGSSKSKLLEF